MTTLPHFLVSTEWLHDHLDAPNVRIVDIRGHVLQASQPPPHYFNHHDDYLAAHIPGAVFIDWVRAITDPADPRHAQIAPPKRFNEAMRTLGISDDTLVVAYDDAGGMFAARLWWALTYYGHPHVAVLDGGWTKWAAENRPMTEAILSLQPGNFSARPHDNMRRTSDEIAARLGDHQQLIDVRTPDEYHGRASRAARAGHIPTAINLPRGELLNANGTMRPPEDLRAQFVSNGIQIDTPDVVFYCNGGVSASYGLLAWRAAGLPGGAIYDGSWKDWGNSDREIET